MTWSSDKLRARRPPCLSEPCSGKLMKLRQCRARGPRNRYPTLENFSEMPRAQRQGQLAKSCRSIISRGCARAQHHARAVREEGPLEVNLPRRRCWPAVGVPA
eukprot:COSAG06_NODE_5298_length_3577_cov_8.494537_4_plen_103_part_00